MIFQQENVNFATEFISTTYDHHKQDLESCYGVSIFKWCMKLNKPKNV